MLRNNKTMLSKFWKILIHNNITQTESVSNIVVQPQQLHKRKTFRLAWWYSLWSLKPLISKYFIKLLFSSIRLFGSSDCETGTRFVKLDQFAHVWHRRWTTCTKSSVPMVGDIPHTLSIQNAQMLMNVNLKIEFLLHFGKRLIPVTTCLNCSMN